MKKLLILVVVIGITFLGCGDNFDNTIVSTTVQTNKLVNSQISEAILASDIDRKDPAISQPIIKVSTSINGEWGGWVTLDTNYTNIDGREVYVYARLRILPGAYQGITNIEMTIDLTTASAQFFPEMVFDRDVRYDLWFIGIDLKELGYNESGNVTFAYFAENGTIEPIENNVSEVDISQSTISVHNAKLYHFSRYGWVRGQQ